MIVMKVEHSISPLGRPAIACEQLLEARRGIGALQGIHAALKQHGKAFVVRHPAIAREPQHFRISGSSIFTASNRRIGGIRRSG
jgi:hypothetical protein